MLLLLLLPPLLLSLVGCLHRTQAGGRLLLQLWLLRLRRWLGLRLGCLWID